MQRSKAGEIKQSDSGIRKSIRPTTEKKIDLHTAASQGNKEVVKSYIHDYKMINSKVKGSTPLHCAIQGAKDCDEEDKKTFHKIIKLLIKNHADVTIDNKSKISPLLLAAAYHMLDALKIMLIFNSLVDKDKKNQAFLNSLTATEALDLFISLLPEINTKEVLNIALQAASTKKRTEFFETLIGCINEKDKNKKEAAGKLLISLELDSEKRFDEFYEAFLKVCKKREDIKTALLDAATTDEESSIFEAGLNSKFNEMLEAASQGKFNAKKALERKNEIEKMLAQAPKDSKDSKASEEKKAQPKFQFFSSRKPEEKRTISKLLTSIKNNELDKVTAFVKEMKKEEIREDTDALSLAILCQRDAEKPNVAIIKTLLKHNFSATKMVKEGKSNMHYAAECKSFSVMRALLETPTADVNMNQLTEDGLTPLHIAAQKGSLPNLVFLARSKANPFVLTPDGKTFLEVFAEENDIHSLFQQHSLRLNLFEKPSAEEETKHAIQSKSITRFLMDKYCETKDDATEKTLLAIAVRYPNSFYKQFKRKDEEFAAEIKTERSTGEELVTLNQQKMLCELALDVKSKQFQGKKVKFHNWLFKDTLHDAISNQRQKIQAKIDELSRDLVEIAKPVELKL